MRLNKRRLAALVMSAVMAASTMPFSAFAEEVTGDLQTVEVEEVSPAYLLDVETIKFTYTESKCEVSYDLVSTKDSADKIHKTEPATVVDISAATCTKPPYVKLKATIQDNEYQSKETFAKIGEKALGHKYEVKNTKNIIDVTHLNDGLVHVWYECQNDPCDGPKEYDEDVTVPAQEHTWAEDVTYVPEYNILLDDDNNPILGDDGKPQLKDKTKDGYYYTRYYCTAKKCAGVYDEDRNERHTIYAEKAAYAMVVEISGIVTRSFNKVLGVRDYRNYQIKEPTVVLPLANDKIELEHCDKDGYYIVVYFNSDGNPISREKIVVTAHHMVTAPAAVFESEDDLAQCVVAKGENGTLDVTNTSCYLPVNYKEVYHCSAAGCNEKACDATNVADPYKVCGNTGYKMISGMTISKTAEPAGEHAIMTIAKQAIRDLYKEIEKPTYDDLTGLLDELEKVPDYKNIKQYVAISEDTSDCVNNGEVTVTFYCVKEPSKNKTVAGTMTVTVYAKGHKKGDPQRENYTAPTCTATGYYDAVTRCIRKNNGVVCNAILDQRPMIIPMLKHTNQLSRDENGTGVNDEYDELLAKKVNVSVYGNVVIDRGTTLYKAGDVVKDNEIGTNGQLDFGARAVAVSVCDNCDHEVTLKETNKYWFSWQKVQKISIEVISVEPQDAAGHAGQIVLQATYKNDDGIEFKSEPTAFAYFTSIEAYQGRKDEDETKDKNGLVLDADGVFRYYTDGAVDTDKTGLVNYYGNQFYVVNGVLASEANGLVLVDDVWYFMADGRVQRQHTGIAMYDGETFYIENGKLANYVNGLVPYMGGTFLFAAGRLCSEVNGLWQDFDETWYFLALGQVQTQHTGVAEYDGSFFYVNEGKLASDYNGIVEYDGAKFNVVAGQLYDQVA